MISNFSRHRRKKDGNQSEVVNALRAASWSVRSLHTMGQGIPDLLVGKWGVTLLVEVKMPGEGLTTDEQGFFATWKGAAVIVYGAEDALTKCNEAAQAVTSGYVDSSKDYSHA